MAANDSDHSPVAHPDSAAYTYGVVLAWRLLRGRQAVGLTQRDLAHRLRVSRALVSAWEQGASLPPAHRIADVAAQLGLEIGALLGPAGQGSQPETAVAEGALVRAAQEELARSAREGREPAQAGMIVHVVAGGSRPRRGRPAGRRASAPHAEAPDPAPRPAPPASPVAATDGGAASATRAADAARLAGRQMRERVRAALNAGELLEHGWARRDLDRYWRILESARGALVARAPLGAREARALAPMLDSLVTSDIRSAADAGARLRAWGTAATPGAGVAARSYFAQVTALGDGFALACVDALAQVRVADTAEDVRVGLLLSLLGSEVD